MYPFSGFRVKISKFDACLTTLIPGTYVQEEIAKMKGVSQNTISRKFRRIKKHLTGMYREAV